MSIIHYSAEKVVEGLRILTTHRGGINDRLIAAWHHAFFAVGAGLTGDLKARWDDIRQRSSRLAPQTEEGAYAATIGQMDEDEAVRLAEDIYDVASEIESASLAESRQQRR